MILKIIMHFFGKTSNNTSAQLRKATFTKHSISEWFSMFSSAFCDFVATFDGLIRATNHCFENAALLIVAEYCLFQSFDLHCIAWPSKMRKAMGPDKIPPEFLKHSGDNFRNWLKGFFSLCLQRLVIPKIWRKALVVAILKPKKPVYDPKSYRPISLSCVSFKVLELLLLTRLDPVVEPALPVTQAGFRPGRSTVDQIVHLTNDIENGFEERKKAGLVLVDLTASCDTVWHSGLALKMIHVIPDHHMVRFLCELLSNRGFTLQTSDGRLGRPRSLKNGVPQGSTLSPLLFNIYISDLPHTQSQQYGYADDLALLYVDKDWN